MAFQTKDGKKKFGSAYVAKRYDDNHGADKMEHEGPKAGKEVHEAVAENEHEQNESPEFERGEHEGAEEGKEETHPVVAQHGPAHRVMIEHDHERGKHKVTSHHKGGHVNMSEHQTSEEAHQEGGKLANVSLKKTDEAGDQQGAASEGDNDHMDGFVMPEMA